MAKKTIVPVGSLRPLRHWDPKGLQVDEEDNIFNSKGNRRGIKEGPPDAMTKIAQQHNWMKLQITGAIGNLRRVLNTLTPPNGTGKDNTIRAERNGIARELKWLEADLLEEVEASRGQAKKNLKD